MNMLWPRRSLPPILTGFAILVTAAGLAAAVVHGRSRAAAALPQPPQSRRRRLVSGLAAVRRRAGRWLQGRNLRAWAAPVYRALLLRASGYRAAAAGLVHAMARADDHVLDVGTGHGEIAWEAARLAARVDATDSAPQVVDRARQLAGRWGYEGVTFRHAAAAALPYPDGHFSLVLSGLLLLALPRSLRQQALQEMFRVLQPDGRVAFFIGPADLGAVPMPDSQWQRFAERAGFVDVRIDDPNALFPVLRGRKPLAEDT